ncbi:MAG: hypothetical protein ACREL7_03275 [Longimicrobiales bacterium]
MRPIDLLHPVRTVRRPKQPVVLLPCVRSVRRPIRLVIVLAMALATSAHVGTDDVFYAGSAGPYPVRVTIRQPGVIPGLADITVRTDAPGIRRVLVTALRRFGERGESPPPDEAVRVPGEASLYSAQLWLMVRGPQSVIVTVAGDAGDGQVTIPIVARATARLDMPRSLAFVLAAGGLFLVAGLLTIVGAATRESVLAPGMAPDRRDVRRGRYAAGGAGLLLALLLFGGWRWIRAEADAHESRLYRPWDVKTSLSTVAETPVLFLELTDARWTQRDGNDLLPDHGKMMHMFIVDAGDASAFAHLHPTRRDENTFQVALPPLPPGEYRVFADIVQEDGATQTLVTEIAVPASGTALADRVMTGDAPSGANALIVDPDDAWWTGIGSTTQSAQLSDDIALRWLNRDALRAGDDGELVFVVERADGTPVSVEPYMGMSGHAMLARRDGQVFVHLHPMGMISVAAQQALASGEPFPAVPHTPDHETSVIRFPMVVPPAGDYRIWVQVRYRGLVLTAAFDTSIRDSLNP